jgi:hypothetical protein
MEVGLLRCIAGGIENGSILECILPTELLKEVAGVCGKRNI